MGVDVVNRLDCERRQWKQPGNSTAFVHRQPPRDCESACPFGLSFPSEEDAETTICRDAAFLYFAIVHS